MAGFQYDFIPCSILSICHKKSGNKFILQREKSAFFKALTYTLYTKKNNEIGSVQAVYEANPYCEDNPLDQTINENWYSIGDIIVNRKYQRMSLEAALVYLIVKEVLINSGQFLYVPLPALTALPFYLSCGFFPKPETVTDMLKNQANRLKAHVHLRRRYVMWRGAIEILNANLHPKFVSRFEIDLTNTA